jgi:hypothetical protein
MIKGRLLEKTFQCTIIVTVALIATAFFTSTMQTSINSTQNINKDCYLKAIADHIVTNSGTPINWGISSSVSVDFGLAAGYSTIQYELDINKVTRLNSLNNYSLSYFDMENSAKLSNIAFGVTVSQVMSINIQQSSNRTVGNDIFFTFSILTSIDSEPADAKLNCYVATNNYQCSVANSTSGMESAALLFKFPAPSASQALLIVFARASMDDRITSYAVYNFRNSTQESFPSNIFYP